ncbi:MAG: GTP 3',8-cyclase MoaA [Planctomycetaceae bacterium]|nr:GTP 3',8-cyclase MoaA [Planctomycetaceae bacterium]
MTMTNLPLLDSFGRRHNNLRISVTDRCNIRCFYCMPAEQVKFLPRAEILTFEEIERLVRLFAQVGVDKLRLTGGEPLVRTDIDRLIRLLKGIPQIRDVAMTTNAVTLARHAERLKLAGLDRLNISLDALNHDTFLKITRRDVLDQVLEGISAAQEAGFTRIRLNAVAIKGLTEAEVLPLARFAWERNLELRFIEYMPLDSEQNWADEKVLSGAAIRELVEHEFGPLVPAPRTDPAQPAFDYLYAGGRGRLGLIHPVTAPFCGTCNRLRLTAEGKLRNCLFSLEEWDLRSLLRQGVAEPLILEQIRTCVAEKRPGHLIGQQQFERPERTMHQIGG